MISRNPDNEKYIERYEKSQEEHNENVLVIVRQTTYTNEEAAAKLEEHNHDVYKVLREFLRIPESKPASTSSINQNIYKEIRATLGSVPIDFQHSLQKK